MADIIKLSDYVPDHDNCGECFFCISTCIKCKSSDVEVEYTVTFRYRNDGGDVIAIVTPQANIEMRCNDCGETFEGSGRKDDERFQKLFPILRHIIGLAGMVKVERKDGEINFQRF